jgi:xylan 1,4-beta-xylosidase
VHLAAHQGDDVLAAEITGDGADVLVRTWATKHDDGTVDVLLWNGTINGALMDGDPRLDREIDVTVDGLDDVAYRADLARVDKHHSNILDGYPDEVAWPDAQLWQRLHEADQLHEQPLPHADTAGSTARFSVSLPMPGVARVRLVPSTATGTEQEGSR